ncbi:MAG: FKBP-type peptidyl-prolyl cis-trans isomerase [Phycisphaerales bacterium]|jgi:peptidylprolyl isomerase
MTERHEMPGGLVAEDIEVGDGAECPHGATVKVHYRGTLEDGTQFDSSYDRGEPITFPLGNLIQGWQIGIPGMKVGGKRRLEIPYSLGYGERGAPPSIPPRANLVFDIELLDVK